MTDPGRFGLLKYMEEDEEPVQLGATYPCRRKDGTYHDGEVVKFRMNKRAGREEYLVHYVGLTPRQAEWVDKTRLMLSDQQDEEEEYEEEEEEEYMDDEEYVEEEEYIDEEEQEEYLEEEEEEYVDEEEQEEYLEEEEYMEEKKYKEEEEFYKDYEEDFVEEGTDQTRNKTATQDPQEDKPQTKKAKLDTSVVCRDQERTCLLCHQLYKDPVKVECGHSFCRRCRDTAWASRGTFSCPHCKKVITKTPPTNNLARTGLQTPPTNNLARTGLQTPPTNNLAPADLRKTTVDTTATLKENTESLPSCPEHNEDLKLYCMEDGQLGCIICRDSLKHRGHRFLAVADAVEVWRRKLSAQVGPLKEAWTKASELTNQQSARFLQIQKNMPEYRQYIMSEFRNLHGFLRDRKERLLDQLQDQSLSLEEEMESNVAKLEKQRDTLRKKVPIARQKVNQTAPASFLHRIREHIKMARELLEEAETARCALVDRELSQGTFKGPLQYFIWREMKSVIPVPESERQPAPLNKAPPKNAPPAVVKNSGPVQETPPAGETASTFCTPGPKVIWIAGIGYVTAAKRRVEKGLLGLNLGFEKHTYTIRWFRSDCIKNVFDRLKDAREKLLLLPDVILFHVGSSDLSRQEFRDLIKTIKSGLRKVSDLYGDTMFILSACYPKVECQEVRLMPLRDALFSEMAKFAENPRFRLLQHPELERMLTARCSEGDVNYLTDFETDLFITSMQDAVLKAVTEGYTLTDDERCDWASPRARAKEIWIVGNAYIFKASLHAQDSDVGRNLGFDEQQWMVRWLGKTTRWFSLLTDLNNARCKYGMAKIVYLHIGSNELGESRNSTQIDYFTFDMKRLVKLYPETKFIFSTILPREEWLSGSLEKDRIKFNSVISEYAEKRGFEVARNSHLEEVLLKRFADSTEFDPDNPDATDALEDVENDIFIASIRVAIEKAMETLDKVVTKKKRSRPPPKEDDVFHDLGSDLSEVQVYTRRVEEDQSIEVKRIWIIGNSYICRSARQANGSYGNNLGFDIEKWVVLWMGQVAMKWEALLPELKSSLLTLGTPSVVFIHLGDNDLGIKPYSVLTKSMEVTLSQLKRQYPNTAFIFSTIIPRAEWLPKPLEQNRKDFNFALAKQASTLGFLVAEHDDIEEVAIPRFKSGGNNVISDAEYDLFVKSIKDSVEKAISKYQI